MTGNLQHNVPWESFSDWITQKIQEANALLAKKNGTEGPKITLTSIDAEIKQWEREWRFRGG